MSVSAIFGLRIKALPSPIASGIGVGGATKAMPGIGGGCGCGMVMIECSSRPKKKATSHHKKTRPRKTQAWDIRRRPTVYPPLPALPPDWTLVAPASDAGEAASPASPPPSSPLQGE
ncbi:hypothetical protein Nepgr_005061 [Nepenthes gracilis]|uniref:50S ribosomal protein 6, chloroplastic n=1 Tax=Nepenthes gracilis TaxID=150966 RepID=A0AAD3XG25_NEPGR|nr:hypothetical protein Nepgr_005061 [Nepenthes gracilis]